MKTPLQLLVEDLLTGEGNKKERYGEWDYATYIPPKPGGIHHRIVIERAYLRPSMEAADYIREQVIEYLTHKGHTVTMGWWIIIEGEGKPLVYDGKFRYALDWTLDQLHLL